MSSWWPTGGGNGGSIPAFNVKTQYGAKGDGVTDDTAALQAAINDAIAANGRLVLPWGTYKTTSVLTCALGSAGSLRISGSGTFSQAGDINAQFNAINYPTQSPYLTGSIIKPSTAGQDAIKITGKWQAIQLEDFGIVFDSAIAFNNTGHGIRSDPDTTGGHPGIGVFDSMWRNLAVFGHDGNHYAYRLVNGIYNQMDHLRGYGGGCLYLENNSWGNFGDSVFNWLYGQVIAGGSAHGIEINNVTSPSQYLDTTTFVRPQITVEQPIAALNVQTNPTSAQHQFVDDQAKARNITFIQPNFVTDSTGSQPVWSTGVGLVVIGRKDNSSGPGSRFPDLSASRIFGGNNSVADTLYLSAIAMQSGAGTSPPAVATPSSNYPQDCRGSFTFGTGTSPASGALVKCSYSTSYPTNPSNGGPVPVIQPLNAAAAALGLYVSAFDSSGFTIAATNAPAASQGNTTYAVGYHVIG